MDERIVLSIIIVNFNTYRYLENCLNSINKSGPIINNIEIIVVDNASKDNSVKFIKRHFPHIQLIKNNKNIGFAKANNQGISRSRGKYILLLNPDTVVNKNTLPETLSFIEKHVNMGVATCKVVLPNGQLDDACHRGFPTPWNAFCQFSGLASLFPHSLFLNGYHLGYRQMERIHEIDSCTGAFMLVKKNVGKKIGWFDEDYFWYGEDIDFCYRIKRERYKIIYYPFVSVLHYKGIASGIKKHSSNLSTASENTRKIATQSRFEVMRIFYRKHYLNKYPSWLKNLIFLGIKFKENINLFKYK